MGPKKRKYSSPTAPTTLSELITEMKSFTRWLSGSTKVKKKSTKKITSCSGIGYGSASTKKATSAAEKKQAAAASVENENDEIATTYFTSLVTLLKSEKDGGESLPSSSITVIKTFIAYYLRNDSLISIGQRKTLYSSLLTSLEYLSDPILTSKFFSTTNVDSPDILNLLKKLGKQAQVFKSFNSKNLPSIDPEIDVIGDSSKNEQYNKDSNNIINALAISLHIETTLYSLIGGIKSAQEIGIMEKNVETIEDDDDESYKTRMSSLSFSTIVGLQRNHTFKNSPTTVVGSAQSRLLRISSEISTLTTSLPLYPSSSIFLRADDTRLDLLSFLITGPEGTPYSSGCFEFDIVLGPNYPNEPPKVKFLSTDSGRCRFNPNLYADGKVCLSLLGTWAGEPWNPKTSTLMQVLVSIQSLIFVDDPFYNEPGYDVKNKSLEKQSTKYNSQVRAATLRYGIMDVLKRRGGIWRPVIERHFRLRKKEITSQLSNWSLRIRDGYDDKTPKTIAGYENLVAGGGIVSSVKEFEKDVEEVRRLIEGLQGEKDVIEIGSEEKPKMKKGEVICLDDSDDNDDDDDDDDGDDNDDDVIICTRPKITTTTTTTTKTTAIKKGSSTKDAIEL